MKRSRYWPRLLLEARGGSFLQSVMWPETVGLSTRPTFSDEKKSALVGLGLGLAGVFRDLFLKLCSSEHSLHHLLPRNRGHPYELPEYCTNLHEKSFIIQSLYLYI